MTISQINPNQLRPADDDRFGRIIRVGPERQAEAIERLVNSARTDRDHARRFLEYAQSHRISLDNLWSRVNEQGRIESTVLAVPSPGRTAMLFASHPHGRDEQTPLAGLIDHACQNLLQSDINLAQVLLEPGDTLERQAFRAGGFLDLAVLSYLERPVRSPRGGRAAAPSWPADMTPTPFSESMRDELLAVLDRSYEETLDCPKLRGFRRTEDILEGHRASGRFDSSLWTILRAGDQAVGALLLNPSADHHTIELVYLGLAKVARGRGLGTQLLRHGLQLIENREERTINLAVDESNAPAISLYRREGFRPALRRLALIRPLGDEARSAESPTI